MLMGKVYYLGLIIALGHIFWIISIVSHWAFFWVHMGRGFGIYWSRHRTALSRVLFCVHFSSCHEHGNLWNIQWVLRMWCSLERIVMNGVNWSLDNSCGSLRLRRRAACSHSPRPIVGWSRGSGCRQARLRSNIVGLGIWGFPARCN